MILLWGKNTGIDGPDDIIGCITIFTNINKNVIKSKWLYKKLIDNSESLMNDLIWLENLVISIDLLKRRAPPFPEMYFVTNLQDVN